MQTNSKQIISQKVKTKYMLRLNNKTSQALINGTKKFAFIAALLLTVGIGSSFAAPTGNSNDIIIASFRKEFKTADVMEIETRKEYTKLTFKLNSLVLFAYYSENGELLAIVRNILSTQLPIQLLMELKQKYSNNWITDLFEISANGQTTYYATLENSDTRITLRSGNTSNWENYHP
jgi:hypothetical protein